MHLGDRAGIQGLLETMSALRDRLNNEIGDDDASKFLSGLIGQTKTFLNGADPGPTVREVIYGHGLGGAPGGGAN